jgi:hypothetical protein
MAKTGPASGSNRARLIEGAHQPFDHRLIDTGARDDVLDDQVTICCAGFGLLAHTFTRSPRQKACRLCVS